MCIYIGQNWIHKRLYLGHQMSKRSYKPHQRLVFNWEESLHTIYLLEPIDYVGGIRLGYMYMCALLNSCIVYLLSIYIWKSLKVIEIWIFWHLFPTGTVGAKVLDLWYSWGFYAPLKKHQPRTQKPNGK